MGIRSEKNRQAEAYLQYLIGNLNSGEVLPPLRQMMRDSGLGRNILENALRKLDASHKVKIRARSGVYVADGNEEKGGNYVDLVACSELGYLDFASPASFSLRLFNALLEEITTHGCIPRVHRIHYYALVTEYLNLIQKHHMDRAFLLLPHHNDIPRLFAAAKIPHVVLLPRYYPEQGPAVIDAPETMDMQLNYLFEHGHRKIGFVHAVDLGMNSLTGQQRREAYYRFMAEHGLTVRPEWVVRYALKSEKLIVRFNQIFVNEPPTALVGADWYLSVIYRCLAERGLKIGRDISVISSDWIDTELSPEPTSVINSPEKIARLGWEFLERRMADPEFATVDYITPGFHEGQSVVSIPAETGTVHHSFNQEYKYRERNSVS